MHAVYCRFNKQVFLFTVCTCKCRLLWNVAAPVVLPWLNFCMPKLWLYLMLNVFSQYPLCNNIDKYVVMLCFEDIFRNNGNKASDAGLLNVIAVRQW